MIDPSTVIWSTPVGERAGKPLLVLLHGLGSHEGDLFQLSPYLPLGHVIAAPRGPIASGSGWSWFDVAAPRPAPLNDSADGLAEWLATVRGEASSVAVLGFSQGGVLGLQTLRRHPELIDAVSPFSAIARPVKTSTTAGVVRIYSAAYFISAGRIFLPRYSGVRPTIKPAMNTVTIARIKMPYSPEPVPPGAISPNIMLNMAAPPPNGVYESCQELIAPVDVRVVLVMNNAEAGIPNLDSLPSSPA